MSDLNQQRRAPATERYRRAVACLMGSADPLKDMTAEDKFKVLGMIGELRAAAGGEWETTLDEIFAGRGDDRERFLAAAREHLIASLDAVERRQETFFATLQAEVRGMWYEKGKRAKADRHEAFFETVRLRAEAAGPTVPGRAGPK